MSLITNVTALQNMNNNLAGSYTLASDIDASATSGWNAGAGFVPVGDATNKFTGSFDGRGFKITGLFINRPTLNNVGLFGFIDGATIKNVGLVLVDITGSGDTGALVGDSANVNTIDNCYSTGTVKDNSGNAGGLIGDLGSGSTLVDSYSTVDVTSTAVTGDVGGLVGYSTAAISKSYATGIVIGLVDTGGLVGDNYGTITDCYARGAVTGTTNVGGLVGKNVGTIDNAYSTGLVTGTTNVGGLVGSNTLTVTASFWDTQTSGRATSDGGTGKTTVEMTTKSTFVLAGWSFVSVWKISPDTNDGYPFLSASVTYYPREALARATALVHRISFGPNAVYQEEILTGGLSSQYFSPVSDPEPTPTLPEPVKDQLPTDFFAPTGLPSLREYLGWIATHSRMQQRVYFPRGIDLNKWQQWVLSLRAVGQEIP